MENHSVPSPFHIIREAGGEGREIQTLEKVMIKMKGTIADGRLGASLCN